MKREKGKKRKILNKRKKERMTSISKQRRKDERQVRIEEKRKKNKEETAIISHSLHPLFSPSVSVPSPRPIPPSAYLLCQHMPRLGAGQQVRHGALRQTQHALAEQSLGDAVLAELFLHLWGERQVCG